ncbi:MAG: helix-turn-helix transcriptional regulator [Thaumarchaeota archaeon]|jgi:DNA-binding HxlR family transcriptional regulator|nr:helix-turn-helix transcriptional regulator [Nitrososphaerota archaeon]
MRARKIDNLDWEELITVLNKISKTWTFPIVIFLAKERPTRFNELKRSVKGICSRSLSERLDELENEGIIKREVTRDSPPKVEYSLTQKGVELSAVLEQLISWDLKWNEINKV